MKRTLAIITSIALVLGTRGLVVMVLWRWFAQAPTGYQLGWGTACGLALIARSLIWANADLSSDELPSPAEQVRRAIGTCAVLLTALPVGAVVGVLT